MGRSALPARELRADRLDTPAQTIGALAAALMLGDEPGDYRCGRSSSAAAGGGLQDRIRPAQLGVLPPQPLELSGVLAAHPGTGTGINLGPAHPFPHGLGRPDPQQTGDLTHRRPLRLVLIADLGDHPYRPFPQLRRIGP